MDKVAFVQQNNIPGCRKVDEYYAQGADELCELHFYYFLFKDYFWACRVLLYLYI